jgi:hypothetical protein
MECCRLLIVVRGAPDFGAEMSLLTSPRPHEGDVHSFLRRAHSNG